MTCRRGAPTLFVPGDTSGDAVAPVDEVATSKNPWLASLREFSLPNTKPGSIQRVLVKLRPTGALRAAESSANLRPLHEPDPMAAPSGFGVAPTAAQWFLADLPDEERSPWDLAHARVADALGVAESDVIFAEPDLLHDIYVDDTEPPPGGFGAVGANCVATPQDGTKGKAVGPANGWHLTDVFSQLASAREAVEFAPPRVRIGHIDTGYYRAHETLPRNVRQDLERNFVDGEDPNNAEDPDNDLRLLDNSGHGTGTLSVLAGGVAQSLGGIDMGGAPDAEVVPLRIADRVVLFRTSAFARALRYAVDCGCDVVSMSMGGLPSEAWREEVDRAYLAGVCLVTAAGNNFGGLPTRHIVYPARYGRVIAACGVMANKQPYTHLQQREMEGNYGPAKVMTHALSAYTPNIPWAVFACRTIVRYNGGGTSSATPQIAAAAALWLEKYKGELPRDWRRVEAVRKALFTTAAPGNGEKLGRGLLQARQALAVRPDLTLPQTKSDKDSFSFLRVITGLGIAEPPPRERMFNVELMQRWLVNERLQAIVPDPDDATDLSPAQLADFMTAIVEDEGASAALRKHVATRYRVVTGEVPPATRRTKGIVSHGPPACDRPSPPRNPAHRRLRVYAVDPSFSTRLDTAAVNEVTLKVRWEPLARGPVGEYLAVRDKDASGRVYAGVNLDDARLLGQDGWAPSEGNAQFHQQMVYAVAMQTIEQFERALGRLVLWRHRINPKDEYDDSASVRHLEIRPHALRQPNAFYSPQDIALLFGYFDSSASNPGEQMPGSRIFTCLSHDIIAHETTHAILDGMHRRFNEATNPDVLGFHEAFADSVALLQHFTIPGVVEMEIARTRGDIESESILGSLAVQFGTAMGGRRALRDAIGRIENGVWKRLTPDPAELGRRATPHARGAILVAAIFDAFIAIYKRRTQDLFRISTSGTGELPAGAIHPDLVRRLTAEASTAASHVLTMCIRALDYLPPVDVTFFEYLRALITADLDMVSDDRYNYRVALIEAFRRRGIYPVDVEVASADTIRTLSVDTLRWRGLDSTEFSKRVWSDITRSYGTIVERLQRYADESVYLRDREQLFTRTREERIALKKDLAAAFRRVPQFGVHLGIDPKRSFEVHELRSAMRFRPDGRFVPQVIVALTQSTTAPADLTNRVPQHTFRGGSTLVVDLTVPEVKYRIVKNVSSKNRRARTAAFLRDVAADPLRGLVFASDRREPFAALHSLADDGL